MICAREDEMSRRFCNKQTMEERGVRIRLKFEEPQILTGQQIEQGLAQSWYLVLLEDVHTIADVAFDVRAAFHLEESCPNGLGFEVDGFALPASQPASLLKDSDLVRIKRTKESQGKLHEPISHEAWNDHITSKEWLEGGFQRFTGCHGVELRALDEFEKETGGYESEEEEGEMETDISLDEGLRVLEEKRFAPTCKKEKDRGGKKHKGAKTNALEVCKMRRTKDMEPRLELAKVKDKCNSVMDSGVSQHVGAELLPLDELVTKTAGEKEVDAQVTVVSREGKRCRKKSEAGSPSPHKKQEGNEKMRKKAKKVISEAQGQFLLKEECRPSIHDEELAKDFQQKVKRKKLNHSGSQPVDSAMKSVEIVDKEQVNLEEADCEDGLKEDIKTSGRKKKSVEVNLSGKNKHNGGRAGVLKKGKAGETEIKEGELESPTEMPRKKGSNRQGKVNVETAAKTMVLLEDGDDLLTRSKSTMIDAMTPESKGNGGSTAARTEKRLNETNDTQVDDDRRPSRSARRKKAKRKWLREQVQMALLPGVETCVPEQNGSTVEINQLEPEDPPVVEEFMEMEAEEEMLPIVVRAGHIRFEPYGKDEKPDQCRSSSPLVRIGDQLKTKRQGQNWGQERNVENRQGNRWATGTNSVPSADVSGDARCHTESESQVDPDILGKLPLLKGLPQEGDVLAYRLVELTAWWTPEISPYRVGVVVHWEHATNVIKLNPHPDYPCLGKELSVEGNEDLGSVEEKESVGPYDENGMLEIELPSLLEVRLVQRDLPDNHEVTSGPTAAIAEELDPATTKGHQGDSLTADPIPKICKNFSIGEPQGIQDADLEDGDKFECAPAWQAIVSEELERKRMELCQRDVEVSSVSEGIPTRTEDVRDQQDRPRAVTVGSEGGKLSNEIRSGNGRKYKYLKSAGVGSIVTLLRAQQAL